VIKALLIAVGALLLSGCRVDVSVDVLMNENGSGVVTVAATADADVVTRAPGLAADLRFDDLIAAGWAVDGPTETAAGGLTVVLKHPFVTPGQATALIASLNGSDGPFRSVDFNRIAGKRAITYTVTGSARIDSLQAFTDPDLLAAVGATPYLDDIAAAGVAPGDAVGLTFSLHLPGTVTASTATPAEDGSVAWTVAVDGVPVDFATTSSKSLERGGAWPLVSSGALVALIAWGVLSVLVIIGVARRQRRHQRRHRRRSRNHNTRHLDR
jgi:hypothetical protein